MGASKNKQVTFRDWLHSGLVKSAGIHYFIIIAFSLQTIVMDAWHIIVPEIVLKRWLATALLLSITAIVWYMSHNRNNDVATYKRLIFSLITADVLFAAYNVYLQRGMASKAVILFAIPIIVSAILLSRSAIYMTAIISTAAYLLSSVLYFVWHFNEGYKTELYAEIAFYAVIFLVLAGLLSVVVRFGGSTNDS